MVRLCEGPKSKISEKEKEVGCVSKIDFNRAESKDGYLPTMGKRETFGVLPLLKSAMLFNRCVTVRKKRDLW